MTANQVERVGRRIHDGAVWLFSLEIVIIVACSFAFGWLMYGLFIE